MELVRYENEKLIVAEEFTKEYAEFQKQVAKMDLKVKEIKEALKEAMEKYGLTGYEDDYIKVEYTKAYQKKQVDTTRFKKELPDVYDEYTKIVNNSSSITIKAKC